MADDKKTLKFQMMMSPEEAEILDDWMFKKRVRSRAAAIRRLWQLGMLADEQRIETFNTVKSITEETYRAFDELSSVLASIEVSDDIMSSVEEIYKKLQNQFLLLLYNASKKEIEMFPLAADLPHDAGTKHMLALKEMMSKLDVQKQEDRDEVKRILELIYRTPIPKSRDATE